MLILMPHLQTVRGGYFNRVPRSRRGDDTEPLLGSSHSENAAGQFNILEKKNRYFNYYSDI
jgi:hypothetical protein